MACGRISSLAATGWISYFSLSGGSLKTGLEKDGEGSGGGGGAGREGPRQGAALEAKRKG